MTDKAKYTVSRLDEASASRCQCSCSNTVTVYYTAAREAADPKALSAREEPVQIKVLEVS